MKTNNENIIGMNGLALGSVGVVKSEFCDLWFGTHQTSSESCEWDEVMEEEEEVKGDEKCEEEEKTNRAKFLGASEEHQLAVKMRNGDNVAWNRLFEAFRPLAKSTAWQCFTAWRSGLEYEDLVAWGYIGLKEGLERFDPTRGSRISSFVTPYITKRVYRATADFGRLIRIPVNQTEKLTAYYRFLRDYEAENGVAPSMEAAAEAVGVRCDRLEHLVSVTGSVKSLDEEIGDSGDGCGGTFGDYLGDSEADVFEGIANCETVSALYDAINAMDKRDAFIVNKRFNLDGEGVCTLDAIANILDLTRERVRQLEKRALEQLRKAVA
jgi:RNA polymerase primary sigma factor